MKSKIIHEVEEVLNFPIIIIVMVVGNMMAIPLIIICVALTYFTMEGIPGVVIMSVVGTIAFIIAQYTIYSSIPLYMRHTKKVRHVIK